MLLCARCGASNAETAPLCGNCGASLKEQLKTPSAVVNQPGQPFARNAEGQAALSIDELPTAHMPGVSRPPEIVPVTPNPFSQALPVEIEHDLSSPARASGDGTEAVFPAQSAFTPQPGRQASDPGIAPLDIADYPTSASMPVPPVSTPPNIPAAPLTRPGRLSLPSRSKTGGPPSQPGITTPPSQPIVNPSASRAHPPSQPGLGQPPGAGGLPPQLGSNPSPGQSDPPSQPGMNLAPGRANPPSQAGIYPQSVQPGIGGPPSQAGIGPRPGPGAPQMSGPQGGARPLSQPGLAPQPPAPVPAPMGNNYPGAPVRPETRGPISQGGMAPLASQPIPSQQDELNKLVRPLPRWARLGGPVAGALLLLGLVFLNPDWATGALIASSAAITLAVLLGIAAGVRVALGMLKNTNPRRRIQMISMALLMLLLLLFSGVGFSQENNLHLVQGRYLESQQNWATAIAEYQKGGERSGTSLDVARTYNEWGEAQDRQQQYGGAVASFGVVINNYQAVAAEFARAKNGIVTAYFGWGDQASQQQDYAGATAHYDALLSLVFCDINTCMNQARAKDATAYYHLAEQRLARQQYAQAVAAYQTLRSRFPTSSEARQVHAHYAQALWGQGQQQLQSSCTNALDTYHLLDKLFADTNEGQQAASALLKPVPVKGHFTQTVPGAPAHPTAYLVQGLVAGMQQYQFPPLLAHAPVAIIHSDGSFAFASVPPGTYELVWSSDSKLHFYYAYSGKHVLYAAHVGPLCSFDYGGINQAIPAK